MRGDEDTGTRGQDGVDLLLRGDPLVARLRTRGLSHECDRCDSCSAQIAPSKYSVFLRLWRTNRVQRSASCQGKGQERHADHVTGLLCTYFRSKRQKELCTLKASASIR